MQHRGGGGVLPSPRDQRPCALDWPLSRDEKKTCAWRFYANDMRVASCLLQASETSREPCLPLGREHPGTHLAAPAASGGVEPSAAGGCGWNKDAQCDSSVGVLTIPDRGTCEAGCDGSVRLRLTGPEITPERSPVGKAPAPVPGFFTPPSPGASVASGSLPPRTEACQEKSEQLAEVDAPHDGVSPPATPPMAAQSAGAGDQRDAVAERLRLAIAEAAEKLRELEATEDSVTVGERRRPRARSLGGAVSANSGAITPRGCLRGTSSRTVDRPAKRVNFADGYTIEREAGATAQEAPGSVTGCAAAGGVVGAVSGGAIGAACGIVPAIFTFGLSIPVFAAVGGSAGLWTGTAVGGAVGLMRRGGSEA